MLSYLLASSNHVGVLYVPLSNTHSDDFSQILLMESMTFQQGQVNASSPTMKNIILLIIIIKIIIFYFENITFFHAKLGSDIFPG